MAHRGRLGEEWVWETQHKPWSCLFNTQAEFGQATGHMMGQKEHMGLRFLIRARKADTRVIDVQRVWERVP